jgi:hypothetical protein
MSSYFSSSSSLTSEKPTAMSVNQVMSTLNVSACVVCQKINAHLCARCRSTAYCGKECQKKHWLIHKTYCKKTKASEQLISNNPLTELQLLKPELWKNVLKEITNNTDSIYVIDSSSVTKTDFDNIKQYLEPKSYDFLVNLFNTKTEKQVVLVIRHGYNDSQVFITRVSVIIPDAKSDKE